MELQAITLDDLTLMEQVHCDPVMMAHLGGPWPKERMPAKLRSVVQSVESGESWYFKIVPDMALGQPAGTVCVWPNVWQGEAINEIGWMILPAFQGRGLGGQAVSAVLEKARAEGRWAVIHAFPAVDNGPSNAICRKAGFALVETCELDYAGHRLRCNHWIIDVRPRDRAESTAA